MSMEKHKDDILVPENLEEVLSKAQRNALAGIGYLGWEPRFLRWPVFQALVLVLENILDGRIGIMGEDGKTRIQVNTDECEQESQTLAPPSKNNLHYY